jgi:hypothetical protein
MLYRRNSHLMAMMMMMLEVTVIRHLVYCSVSKLYPAAQCRGCQQVQI